MAQAKKLRRMTITPAENGHMVECEHEPEAETKPSKNNPFPTSYQEPEKHVFSDGGAVGQFVTSKLKTHDAHHKPHDLTRK